MIQQTQQHSEDVFIFGMYPCDPTYLILPPDPRASNLENHSSSSTLKVSVLTHRLNKSVEYSPDRYEYLFLYGDIQDNIIDWSVARLTEQLQAVSLYWKLNKPCVYAQNLFYNQLPAIKNKSSVFSKSKPDLILSACQLFFAKSLAKQIIEKNRRNYYINISKNDIRIIFHVLAYIEKNTSWKGPFLIIVENDEAIKEWISVLKLWTRLKVLEYNGNDSTRKILQELVFPVLYESGLVKVDYYSYNILITTSELAVTDFAFINRVKWEIVIISPENSDPIYSICTIKVEISENASDPVLQVLMEIDNPYQSKTKNITFNSYQGHDSELPIGFESNFDDFEISNWLAEHDQEEHENNEPGYSRFDLTEEIEKLINDEPNAFK